jgi:hypothetical protein
MLSSLLTFSRQVVAHKEKLFEELVSLYAQTKAKHLRAAADATTAAQVDSIIQEIRTACYPIPSC